MPRSNSAAILLIDDGSCLAWPVNMLTIRYGDVIAWFEGVPLAHVGGAGGGLPQV